MRFALTHGFLVLDEWTTLADGTLIIEDGKIEKVLPTSEFHPENMEVVDLHGETVYPGFIDLHVHGGMGRDFIEGAGSIEAVSDNVVADGTTAFLCSLTVQSHEQELKSLKGLSSHQEKGAQCLGIHMEGPYLSAQYKALMDERYLRDPSESELMDMLAANPEIRTMTVAPERAGMKEFIPLLRRHHIVPMIGHTACTCRQAEEAHLWGAMGFTHLYNAMSQHTHRDPGCVTAAFLHDDMYKEMILDGFHTDDAVIRMTYKCLGPHQIIMITDAMLGKGMPDGEYVFSGLHCRKEGIHVRVIETGRIAGSAFGMIDAVRHLNGIVALKPEDICALTSANAAHLIQDSSRGSLRPGARADITVLSSSLAVRRCYVAGKLAYSRA